MISEREELTLKNGATITLTNGEDGVTVNITGFDEPMIGTYTDIKKMTKDIGEYLSWFYEYWHMFDFRAQEQDREDNKLAIRLRRINPKYTRIDYLVWLSGED